MDLDDDGDGARPRSATWGDDPYKSPQWRSRPRTLIVRRSSSSNKPTPSPLKWTLPRWGEAFSAYYDAHGSSIAVALILFAVVILPIILWGGIEFFGEPPFEPEAAFGAWGNETLALGEFIVFSDEQWLQPATPLSREETRQHILTEKIGSLLSVHRDIHRVCTMKVRQGELQDIAGSGTRLTCKLVWKRTKAAIEAIKAADSFYAVEWPEMVSDAAAGLATTLSGEYKEEPQDCVKLLLPATGAPNKPGDVPLGYCPVPARHHGHSSTRQRYLSLAPLAEWQLSELSDALARTDKPNSQCQPRPFGIGSSTFHDNQASSKYLHASKDEAHVYEAHRHVEMLLITVRDMNDWAAGKLAKMDSKLGVGTADLFAIFDRLPLALETLRLHDRLARRNAKAAAAHCAWRERIVSGVKGLMDGEAAAWYDVSGSGRLKGVARTLDMPAVAAEKVRVGAVEYESLASEFLEAMRGAEEELGERFPELAAWEV